MDSRRNINSSNSNLVCEYVSSLVSRIIHNVFRTIIEPSEREVENPLMLALMSEKPTLEKEEKEFNRIRHPIFKPHLKCKRFL